MREQVGDRTLQCPPSLAAKPQAPGLQRIGNLLLHGQGDVRVETFHAGGLVSMRVALTVRQTSPSGMRSSARTRRSWPRSWGWAEALHRKEVDERAGVVCVAVEEGSCALSGVVGDLGEYSVGAAQEGTGGRSWPHGGGVCGAEDVFTVVT
jgi:hypothetical protein